MVATRILIILFVLMSGFLGGCQTRGGYSSFGLSYGSPPWYFDGYYPYTAPWASPYYLRPYYYRPYARPFYYSPYPYYFSPYRGPSYKFYGAHPKYRYGPRWGSSRLGRRR